MYDFTLNIYNILIRALSVYHTVPLPKESPPKPTLPKKIAESARYQFLDFHPTEIARQLTLMEHQRFHDIPVCYE